MAEKAPARGRTRMTRFVVMAMLQAARGRALGLGRNAAFSWGLNRAIFYAAAKRGFGRRAASGEKGSAPAKPNPPRTSYFLGDEMAFRDPDAKGLYFTIGGDTQTERDFERQIAARFGSKEAFERAWAEAEAIVRRYDEETLTSQRHFFDRVYKPRRDELVDEWGRPAVVPSGPPG
jgi:hypothetical protein